MPIMYQLLYNCIITLIRLNCIIGMSNYRLRGEKKVTYLTLTVVSEEGLPHRFCSRGKFPVQESLASSTVTRAEAAPGAPPASRPFPEQGSDREGICHLVPHQ